MKRPSSLQARLLAPLVGLTFIVWLLTAAWVWVDVRHEVGELLDGHLAQSAALLVAQQAHEAHEDDFEIDAPSLHRYSPKVAFQVFHEDRLALRSANAPSVPMVAAGTGSAAGFQTVTLDGVAWRVFAIRDTETALRVYVAEQTDSRNAIVWAVMRSSSLPGLLTLPLLMLAFWWAVRSGMTPLRQLGQALTSRQPHTLHPVMLADVPTEMAPMIDALNGLFRRIADLMESERRFTADAAHELRTPIAAIRTQAQVALAESDELARRHALQATLAGCDRATRLVEQLLTLSRLEFGSSSALVRVDLCPLIRAAVAAVAPQALGKSQSLLVEADQPCPIAGDTTLLTVLIRNLVDNAIRYSPRHATVKVVATVLGARVQLRVDDSGPGMTVSHMQRVGERFFRVLGSGEEGSGLGWSIARRIAAVHGAQVRVSPSVELGGLSVEVEWPVFQNGQGPFPNPILNQKESI